MSDTVCATPDGCEPQTDYTVPLQEENPNYKKKNKTLLPYSVVEKKMAQELNNDGLSESKNCRKKQ